MNDQLSLNLPYTPVIVYVRTERKKVVKVTVYVNVEGEEFELNDLVRTLEAVYDGDTVITNKRMCTHLTRIGVLNDCGNKKWMTGAERGPRFKSLIDQLSALDSSGLEGE